jgi:putative polyhydroxyalkanoate system protein
MSEIHLKQSHSLTRDETRKRVEAIAKELKRAYKMEYAWDGDHVRFRRTGASGWLYLGEGFIELEIKLGMLLAPLKGKIEEAIRRDIQSKIA